MAEKYNWLDVLPLPVQAALSYDPTELANVALHARLMAGAGFTLTPSQQDTYPVLHWWTGTAGRPARNGRGRTPCPAVALLFRTGKVGRVWGWPSVNNWLDFVLDLHPARLKQRPLWVKAVGAHEPGLDDVVWRFSLGD